MGQKETIVDLLKTKGTMTQLALAEAMYGDKNHDPNIYDALMGLVNSGVVLRTGSQPAYYSLTGEDIVIPEKVTQPKKGVRDVSGDEITNETIEEAGRIVAETDNYGPEMEMITRCLRRFPDNTRPGYCCDEGGAYRYHKFDSSVSAQKQNQYGRTFKHNCFHS